MPDYLWQKSTYCGEASNCLNIAASGDGSPRLRESDTPDVVLALGAHSLGALLRAIKSGWPPPVR
ncbi:MULTISPECIES: DUF397 domain-containing protein [Streptomyces]|uniref:DUF397 domain-containing protein n=1 Tax=Streptomyces luteosporeus TaxID=173856 RepID=A0ABN3TK42_9ACTN